MKVKETTMLLNRSILVSIALALSAAGSAQAQDEAAERRAELDAHAAAALQTLYSAVDGSQAMVDGAAGYAVFRATRAGLGVTGGGGGGVAVDKANGNTVYMNMGMAGVGWSFGAQTYDLIVVFETADRLQNFISGGWEGAAGAQASAGDSAAEAAVGFIEGTAIFTLTETGAMASANVTGTRFWVSEELN